VAGPPTNKMAPAHTEELILVMRDLKTISARLGSDKQASLFMTAPNLHRLQEVLASLGQARPARPLRTPADIFQEWQNFVDGHTRSLSPRAVRYLCWEPDVAINPTFHGYLESTEGVGTRSLQGIVHSTQAKWSSGGANLLVHIEKHLALYKGPNRILAKWRGDISLVADVNAAARFGAWLVNSRADVREAAADWHFQEHTEFMVAALQHASEISRTTGNMDFLLQKCLPWSGWPLQTFKAEVGKSVLHDRINSEAMRHFVLQDDRLGDPRHPSRHRNWYGISDQARARVIQWLCKYDIRFFFDLAFPKGADRHGRKSFWLEYFPALAMARPLLNPEDRLNLRREYADDVARFGKIKGANSAFVLDFGRVVAVEFNRVGACYIYEKRALTETIPDFWTDEPFTEQLLKRKDRCVDYVRHTEGWQRELRMALAQFGVRP
jgi:hypothetical protein